MTSTGAVALVSCRDDETQNKEVREAIRCHDVTFCVVEDGLIRVMRGRMVVQLYSGKKQKLNEKKTNKMGEG